MVHSYLDYLRPNCISMLAYILICILPLLSSYDYPAINIISVALMYLYSLCQMSFWCKRLKNPLVYVALWAALITAVMFIVMGGMFTTSVNRTIATMVIFLTLLANASDQRIIYLLRIYKLCALWCVIYFIVQVVFYYFLNKPMMFKIPFLELREELRVAYTYLERAYQARVSLPRFPGPFSEPSHYAAYILPLMAFYLCGYKQYVKKNFLFAIVIAATLVLSTSLTGIVVMATMMSYYFFVRIKQKKLIITVLTFLLVFGAILLPLKYNFNLGSLFGPQKFGYRIYRGIDYYSNLPLINKLVGIGLYNAEKFADSHNIETSYDRFDEVYEYFNGVSQVLIYIGGIGGLFFIWYLVHIIYLKNNLYTMLCINYVLLLIATSTFINNAAHICLALLFCVRPDKEERSHMNIRY